jgi:hypothetical protein
VVNLLATGTAKSGVDYVAIPKSVTIPAGSESVEVNLTPIADLDVEGAESVTVTLAGGSYLIGAKKTATIKVADTQKSSVRIEALDDAGDVTATGTFRIWRSGQTAGQALVVRFEVAGVRSSSDAFIVKDAMGKVLTDSVAIPAGFAFVDVIVTPSVPEAGLDAEMRLTLLTDSAYQIEDPFKTALGRVRIPD